MKSVESPAQDRRGRGLRDLRISVLDQCNFRCPYCMPAETFHDGYPFLKRDERLSFDEIATVAGAAATVGVSKLRLTGGEPLLRRDLHRLVAQLASIDGIEDLALTTNGMLLAAQAAKLKQAGLARVTVSLDSLDEKTFRRMSGERGDVATVLAGIDTTLALGFDSVKVNTVVQRGLNDADVLDIVDYFRHRGPIVRFIEYMDVGNRNGWQSGDVVSSSELLERIAERWPLVPVAPAYRGEVARRYRFVDGGGEIGFISSVSQPFCGDCHRARLSADGQLYTCLFASTGIDLRTGLRAGDDVANVAAKLRAIWAKRSDNYSEQRGPLREHVLKKVEMFRIGG
ncbi:MAG: GTP 3',8-cyclase MoaA [Pseudomonadota bacterium]